MYQHLNRRDVRTRERAKIENLLAKIMKENLPNLVENKHTRPEAQSPKQDGPKADHIKIHHN